MPPVAAARRVEHDDIVEHGLRDHAARALDGIEGGPTRELIAPALEAVQDVPNDFRLGGSLLGDPALLHRALE